MGYFKSRAFAVSLVVGIIVASLILLGPAVGPRVFGFGSEPCPVPAGTVLAGVDGEAAGARDLKSYAAPIAPRGQLQICLKVGDLRVVAAAVPMLEVDVLLPAGAQVGLFETADGVAIAQIAGGSGRWWGHSSAGVDVVVRVPQGATVEYDVQVAVGSATGEGLAGTGDQRWSVAVGDLNVAYGGLAGALSLSTEVGEVRAGLPLGPAYTVVAVTDVGSVGVGLAGFVMQQHSREPPGESMRGSTSGSPAVQVVATADVGAITLRQA